MSRFTRRYALWLLGIAAALAAGCGGEARRPYESIPSAEEAARLADVVVEGEVTTSEGAERIPVSTTESNLSGGTNIDCIRKT
ncbi:MAG: hypothetical protein IMZ62_10820, partial [Chloroflexi bacterium]|nr:hypothetical protein [Chloroflexota bacterium]